MPKILVTGATGFIASHIIKLFLNEGYFVKGTVRNLNDERIQSLKKFDKYSKLEIIAAELLDSSSIERATKNVDIVIHTATTVIMNPTDEQSVLRPSIEGTMNVLNAAFKSNVKRFIYTSSSFAVTGHDIENRLYTDKDWADIDKLKCVYTKAKLLAEKTTWDFVQNKRKNNESCFDLSVIIPVVTMGPLLLKSIGSTPLLFLNTIKNSGILENQYKAFCDVRDVALAHYKAAILPDAVDKRHIIVSIRHRILISDWIKIFNEEFNSKGYFSATKFDKYENVFGNLTYDDSNMKEILKIIPHDVRKTIVDMVDSFIKFDIIKKNQ